MRCLARSYYLIPLLAARQCSALAFRERRVRRVASMMTAEEQAQQKREGQTRRRNEKAARREDRISVLESQSLIQTLSDAELAELEGLLRVRSMFEEQYDPASFSQEHRDFKRLHNEAFLALARYCQHTEENLNVSYLDGQDGGTTSAMVNNSNSGGLLGLDPSQCFVANRHLSTCQALRISGGGELPEENVLHATAAEALSIDWKDLDFSAYYFDGCGGFVPHVIGMMSAALLRTNDDNNSTPSISTATTAVGFSLMGGKKDVVDKELQVCQALAVMARTRGLRTRHVLDDPTKYGIPMEIRKTDEQTFTTWILLEPDT